METNYKPNSFKSKEEAKEKEIEKKKEIKPVATGKRKKNKTRKFTDAFVSEDVSSVKSYILMDVMIPALKKLFSEMVTNSVDMILWGEPRSRSKKASNGVSYTSYYEKKDRDRDYSYRSPSNSYGYDDIVLESRKEAEEVLDAMFGIIDTYGSVSIADLYELVGSKSSFTDNNYGWMSLRTADIVRTRDGFWIKLPKAVALK